MNWLIAVAMAASVLTKVHKVIIFYGEARSPPHSFRTPNVSVIPRVAHSIWSIHFIWSITSSPLEEATGISRTKESEAR